MFRSVALCVAVSSLISVGVATADSSRRQSKLEAKPNALIFEESAKALIADKLEDAAAGFTELAARNPRDPSAQTLLALTYHKAAERNPQNLELANAGYDLALNVQPNNFWAAAFAGRAAYDRGEYDVAASRFAQAVLARPGDGRAMFALASSAYMAGDVELAAIAANQAVILNEATPEHTATLRLATLSNAAVNNIDAAHAHLTALQQVSEQAVDDTQTRMGQIEQTNPVDAIEIAPAQESTVVSEPSIPDQISVDVAIVLSQRVKRSRIGLNLMDGLNLNYGYGRNYSDSRVTFTGVDSATTGQRVITRAINIPELNYNLNIFNRTGQYYSVLARPSLTAYRGQTSEFFVGRSLKVAVSGVNFSSLEQIDIGIEMKVTPIDISAEGTLVKIETSRSFLTQDAAGTFREGISTFKQRVAATAQVRFNQTLILSGLSESVDDNTFSKTPLLGELPIVGAAFNERSTQSRRDAALMLITPSLTTSLPGLPQLRSGTLDKISRLWTKVVDPASNAVDIGARLGRMRFFTRALPTDAPLSWPSPTRQTAEALRELLLPHVD